MKKSEQLKLWLKFFFVFGWLIFASLYFPPTLTTSKIIIILVPSLVISAGFASIFLRISKMFDATISLIGALFDDEE